MLKATDIYGSVLYKGKEYHCEEIANVPRGVRLLYGIDWVYSGDCFFEECDIVVGSESFAGRNALKQALEHFDAHR